ncbi:winged helix-turn-helix domain-containing protein [Maricaulis sp.]|uniref:winged helix-turn-helix domain-containing protein n=1 Tax=Maricaulis sp. TaxID=1486257 RepID=UPI00262265C4|nr:winged helix-turn-helix domain-containing protein [Maricaulis sp.]
MTSNAERPTWYALDAVQVEISEGLLQIGAEQKRLEPRIAGVLALLVQRNGEAVTRDEFLDTVWDEDGSDEALTQAISRLRHLLGDRDLIKTLPRIGYRLSVTPLRLAAAPTDQHPVPDMPTLTIPKTYIYGLLSGAALVIAALAMTLIFAAPSLETRETIELEVEDGPDVEFHRIPDDG